MKTIILNAIHGNMMVDEGLAYASHFLSVDKVKQLANEGKLEFQLAPNREGWADEVCYALGVNIPKRPKDGGRNRFLQFHEGDKCILIEKKSSFEELNFRFFEVTFFSEKREKGIIAGLRKRFAG